jgi:hypothetical protein
VLLRVQVMENFPVMLPHLPAVQARSVRRREIPILPFTGENSYRCFTGGQKYF